jgi:AcrR family transcriptional regulator
MPRPAKHDESRILRAAGTLASAGGPAAATIVGIAAAIGAPSGSIYHRFKSRDELLGRLWLAKATFLQDRWMSALALPDPVQAGLAACLSIPRSVREDLEGARIMLLYRREDFLSDGWPAAMKSESKQLGAQVEEGLETLTRRLFGRHSLEARQTATLAVLDLPMAGVRRFVTSNESPPRVLDATLERAYFAIIDERRQPRRA